jgi:hypothetical protein
LNTGLFLPAMQGKVADRSRHEWRGSSPVKFSKAEGVEVMTFKGAGSTIPMMSISKGS